MLFVLMYGLLILTDSMVINKLWPIDFN